MANRQEILIAQMVPELKAKYSLWADELKKRGIGHRIIQVKRTIEIQKAYYAQGRQSLAEVNLLRKKAGLYVLTSDKENIVCTWTMASKHLESKAFDFVITTSGRDDWNCTEVYKECVAVAKTIGLKSNNKEFSHLEI